MPTLTKLLSELAEKYDTDKRPSRYFDVPKRGQLSSSEIRYVKRRFKEFVEREKCVASEPDNPSCYEKVSTDKTSTKKKRKSSYANEYKRIYRTEKMSTEDFFKSHNTPRGSASKGLKRISVETGLPLKYLKEVYNNGVGAYASSGSRAGMAAEQWGYGRVFAFIMSYFHNEDGGYNNKRFLKNKTDFHIFEKIVKDMM